MGGEGRRYYVLEHKVSTKYHKAGEDQKIIVDQIELGRDPKCQVRFDESFNTVSRRHAAIVKDGDNWKLVQLSKTNSTYLNGHKVEKEWYLQNGDEIQLSTNGPRMGFIIPEGDKGLVKSIGLSQRLSLFRKQALRPYKQGLAALACVLVLCVGVGTFFILQQQDTIEQYRAENVRINEEFKQKLADQQQAAEEARAAQEEENQRQQQQHQQEINRLRGEYSRAIAAAEQRIAEENRRNQNNVTGFAALLEEQGVAKDVYYFRANKVIYEVNGQEHQINSGSHPYGWSGTGFLLNDGKFVTARHCVEGWLYEDFEEESEIAQAVTAASSFSGIKIKAYFTAVSSKSGNTFNFTSDDFTINHSLDKKVQIGVDEDGDPAYWVFPYPVLSSMPETMWSTDWAYTTNTGGKRGEIEADGSLSRSLMPLQDLIVLGFPRGIGANDGNNGIEPIPYTMTTSRQGLAANGCILHSRGTDHGNSGGPIFALKDNKLVVVGIVSRGDHRTEEYNWAVPICNIQ